jgi:hypothetical protein
LSRRPLAELCVLLLLAACRGQTGGSGGGQSAAPDPLAEARQLLQQGQADAALARLQGASDPEALVLQGRAWAKKAEMAPLPTPAPLASPLPRGASAPGPPEFKFEELQAIDCFERAVAAKPELAAGHLALAELLGPHALARRQEANPAHRPRHGAAPEPVKAALPGPDASPERVLREYRLAAQAVAADKVAVDSWVLFATSVGQVEDADAAFQELLKREREKPEPFVRYGDFLLVSKKDAMGAIAQYSQALMWKPDDETVKGKIAEIYLGIAADHLAHQQYASGEARLKDAQKYIGNKASAQGMRLQDLQQQVAQIRGRPPGR